jgi:hypothetical protein
MGFQADHLIHVFERWALQGNHIRRAMHTLGVSWAPVQRMVQAAQDHMRGEGERLRRLLACANQHLAPLADPLLVDFGTHRWLKQQREEAYSDWLAWIMAQLKTPERVGHLLGLPATQYRQWQGVLRVEREAGVKEGHEGQTGRLDLLVTFGMQEVLAIEVKTTDAESADTAKGARYSRSLPCDAHRILLATSGAREAYEGDFRLVTWDKVCLALRSLARACCQAKEIMLAAMILAFVGAVEANLLGFPAKTIQGVMQGMPLRISSAVGNHIEQWLRNEGIDGSA